MSTVHNHLPEPGHLVRILKEVIEKAVIEAGSTKAIDPGKRIPFVWPPESISHEYHVLARDWIESATYSAYGELFPVKVARNEYGVFGRCERLWIEAKGESVESMLKKLAVTAEPLLRRQISISHLLGFPGRFIGYIRDLAPEDLIKLLYSADRDIGIEARSEIETHASLGIFGPVLVEILRDNRHPLRRAAQWSVLDMYEDLPSFYKDQSEQAQAVDAMKQLLWNAEDDYCRAVYKAGVVLGGHVPVELGHPALRDSLKAESRFGRRSAIHGFFHVVEWTPDRREEVAAVLKGVSTTDPDSQLREYAARMAEDIAAGRDHGPEPLFPEEIQ